MKAYDAQKYEALLEEKLARFVGREKGPVVAREMERVIEEVHREAVRLGWLPADPGEFMREVNALPPGTRPAA